MPLLGTIKRKSQPDPEFKIVWEVPTLSSQEQMHHKDHRGEEVSANYFFNPTEK